jgi:hypothetical protein
MRVDIPLLPSQDLKSIVDGAEEAKVLKGSSEVPRMEFE